MTEVPPPILEIVTMRITYTRSGGFAGVRRPPLMLDTATMPNDEARAWERLVAAADFFTLPATIASKGAQADRFQFSIKVQQDDGREHSVTVSEDAVPTSLGPLVQRLQDLTKKSG
jgi:emfourin